MISIGVGVQASGKAVHEACAVAVQALGPLAPPLWSFVDDGRTGALAGRRLFVSHDPQRLAEALHNHAPAAVGAGPWQATGQVVKSVRGRVPFSETGLGAVLLLAHWPGPASYLDAARAAARGVLGLSDVDYLADSLMRDVVVVSDQALGARIIDATELGLEFLVLVPVGGPAPAAAHAHAIGLAARLAAVAGAGWNGSP